MANLQITGSIVVYKQSYTMLEAAVKSFLCAELTSVLFVIDNSPTSNLQAISALNPRRVRYIFNDANLGYGAGHNIGIEKAIELNAAYHIALNPDIYFYKDCLEHLYHFMEHHPAVGQVMPKVLYPDGRLQRLCRTTPSFTSLMARRFLPFFMHSWFRKTLNKTEYGNESYDEIMYDIPFLSGCCMFFRTQSLKDIGLFDERFFLYLEDADITRRMLQKWRTAYYPGSIIYHHYGKGSYKSLRLTWYHIRSAVVYFRKWGL